MLERFFSGNEEEEAGIQELRSQVKTKASRLGSRLSSIGNSLLTNSFKHLYQKPLQPFGSGLPMELSLSAKEIQTFAEELALAPSLERDVSRFVSEIANRRRGDEDAVSAAELSARVAELLDGLLQRAVAEVPFCAIPSSLSEEDKRNKRLLVLNLLENHVMSTLHSHCFAPSAAMIEQDRQLLEKIRGLQFVTPAHLEISLSYHEPVLLETTRELLCSINAERTPLGKLVALIKCFQMLYKAIEKTNTGQSVGADELLPLLIYIMIKANPPCLHSNVHFVSMFRHPSLMVGESAYYFMTFAGAVTFIQQIEADTLRISEEEYNRGVAASNARNDVEAYDVARHHNAFINRARNESDEWVVLDSSGPSRIHQQKTVTDADQMDPRRFLHRTAESLSLEEVRDLLAIYHKLVMEHVQWGSGGGGGGVKVSPGPRRRLTIGSGGAAAAPPAGGPFDGRARDRVSESGDWAALFPRFGVKLNRAVQPSPIVHTGFLLKAPKGQLFQGQWAPRFCVLLNTAPQVVTKDQSTAVQHTRKGTLRWFEDAEAFECINCMDLSTVIGIYEMGKTPGSLGPMFTLESANRTITFCAQTEEDVKAWVNKLAFLLQIEPERVQRRA